MKTAIGVAVFAVALGAGLASHVVSAQAGAAGAVGAAAGRTPNVEFEMMTWPEVKKAMADGKTTALVYNGGAELPVAARSRVGAISAGRPPRSLE